MNIFIRLLFGRVTLKHLLLHFQYQIKQVEFINRLLSCSFCFIPIYFNVTLGTRKFITMKIHVCVAKIRCEYLCFIFGIFLIHQCKQFYIFLDKIFKGRNDILNLCRRFIQIDKVSLVLQLVILVTGC